MEFNFKIILVILYTPLIWNNGGLMIFKKTVTGLPFFFDNFLEHSGEFGRILHFFRIFLLIEKEKMKNI